MKPPIQIENRVRELREQHGSMTQAQLGKIIGVTRQTVAAIENRQYSPSLESAFRMARAFGRSIDEVFSWEE